MPITSQRLARDAAPPEESASSEPGSLVQALRLIAALRKQGVSDTDILDLLANSSPNSVEPSDPPAAAMDSARREAFLQRFPDAARIGGGLPTPLPQRRPASYVPASAATLQRRAARFPHAGRM